MTPTALLLDMLENLPVVDHARLEIDGLPCTIDNFWQRYYDGAIVRIIKHLYMDGQPLTEGAPKWANLWEKL